MASVVGFAQTQLSDSIMQLKQVQITAQRIQNFSSGTKIQNIDSALISQYSTNNLADLLENESPLFVKSYGMGSLATTSFRGGNANQTAVLWNGFNINSPMNGQLDFALIPNDFLEKVDIQYGGGSALWGSGAVGGTIHLNNESRFDEGWKVNIGGTFGSFDNYQQQLKVLFSQKKWVSSFKFFNHTAQNDFPFYNTLKSDTLKQIQRHAQLKQFGLLTENSFKINENQQINFCIWYQNTDRNIPPLMLQTLNNTNQKDETKRFTTQWQRNGKMTNYFIRTAYFDENLIYSDYSYSYVSPNRAKTFIAEAESKINLNKNNLLNLGTNNTFVKASSDGYSGGHQQNRTAIFVSYRFISSNKKLQSAISARQEMLLQKLMPFVYSFGAEYKFSKWFSAKCNAAKVYRIPTLNDLYWNPGGNSALQSEKGFSEDAGLLFHFNLPKQKINFSFEPTVFNKIINNWILWLPGESFWSPQNILEVWSRGMETRSELKFAMQKISFKLNLMTNYVLSTNEKASTENDASLHKQLIYTPMYSGHLKLSLQYKKVSISYLQNYTGYRYTSTDNTEFLTPFTLANIYTSYQFVIKNFNINFFAEANNIFNQQYQVLLNRAMPLVNYQAGFSIQFHQNNKQNSIK